MKKKNAVILRQGNPLTESRYQFSKMEKNVLYVIIKFIRNNWLEREMPNGKWPTTTFYIPPAVFNEANENNPERAKEALRGLRDKTIEMTDKEGNWLYAGFINQAEYNAKADMYEVEVSGALLPYLVQLTRNYTEYDLTVAMTFRSQYSQRFYELCCQYRNYGGFGKTIQQLKEMFMLEDVLSYRNIWLFNSKVINTALKEIKSAYDDKSCNLFLTCDKSGRAATTHYKFTIHTREEETRKTDCINNVRAEYDNVCAIVVRNVKNDPKYIKRVQEAVYAMPEKILEVNRKLQDIEMTFKRAEAPKVIRFMLKDNYGIK